MVVDDVALVSASIVKELFQLGLWLKAVGAVVILWILFQFINFFINRNRMKEIFNIKKDMKRMEKKLDKLLNKK